MRDRDRERERERERAQKGCYMFENRMIKYIQQCLKPLQFIIFSFIFIVIFFLNIQNGGKSLKYAFINNI